MFKKKSFPFVVPFKLHQQANYLFINVKVTANDRKWYHQLRSVCDFTSFFHYDA